MSGRDSSIYQEIWTADQKENGVPAILPSTDTTSRRDSGYAIVNEPEKFDKDTRIVEEVYIPDNKKRTYDLCEKLFDNYNIRPDIAETETNEEVEEMNDFINAIKDTAPMRVAREYIDSNLSDQEWFDYIKSVWFTMFRTYDRSGFEHVFVGEKSSRGRKVGGYHFWYKYYIDDGRGEVNGKDTINYSGAKYGQSNGEGRKITDIVTLSYDWEAIDAKNNSSDDLFKKIGGFWVGCSPEGLMALGLARFSKGAPTTVINGVEYDVKLFKDDNGKYINTFYPVFKRIVSRAPPEPPKPEPDPDVVTPRPDPDPEDPGGVVISIGSSGDVRIIAALVNPEGHDVGKETVTLINISNRDIDLSGWKIVDKNNNSFTLSATLAAGETRAITLPEKSAQLSNKGGEIILEDSSGKVIDEVSFTRRQAQQKGVTILFGK